MYKRLLIAALTICLALAACDVNTRLQNIETGSITIQSALQTREFFDQQYQHAFKFSFDSTPNIIFALQGFFSRSSMITEWNVLPKTLTATKITLTFYHKGSEWNSITFGFWASARPDIELGNFIETIDSSVTKNFVFSKTFSQSIPTDNQTIVRTFLNGYMSEVKGLVDIKIIHQLTGISKINFILQTGDMTMKKIYLSYIIYNSVAAGFKSYGGSRSEQQFRGSRVLNFQKTFQVPAYTIHGIVAAKFQNAINFRFSSQLDDQFYFRIDSSGIFEQLSILFIAAGVSTSDNCAACSEKYISGNQCVAACSANQYQVTYPDGAKGCRYCSADYGYVISNTRQGCACPANQVLGPMGFCVLSNSLQTTVTTQTTTQTTNNSAASQTAASQAAAKAAAEAAAKAAAEAAAKAAAEATAKAAAEAAQKAAAQAAAKAAAEAAAKAAAAKNTGSSSSNFGSTQTQQSNSNGSFFFSSGSSQASSFTTPSIVNNAASQSSSSSSFATSFETSSSGFSTAPQTKPAANTQTSTTTTTTTQNIVPTSSIISVPKVTPKPIIDLDCSTKPNTFFNGVQCSCKVGFLRINGACVAVPLVGGPDIYVPPEFIHSLAAYHKHKNPTNCQKPNQFFNGQFCECKPGFSRNANNDCQQNSNCKPNSILVDGKCQCKPGFVSTTLGCIPTNSCPDHAYHNGVTCVCNQGYYMNNGQCNPGKLCEKPNSVYIGGVCVCVQPYFDSNGSCTKCPQGKYYINGKCVLLCGSNQIADSTGKCICRSGYGKYENGVCSECPSNTYIVNGYCIVCPIGSSFDQSTSKCICKQGFSVDQNGFCKQKCSQNQEYNYVAKKCKCKSGLGRINNVCQECKGGFIDPATEICVKNCRPNQSLVNGICKCNSGFGISDNNDCVQCSKIPGSFEIDGYCATCPAGQIVGVNQKCKCPNGQQLVDGKCKPICEPNQLVDEYGYCYECPIMEIAKDGVCVCREGLQRINGICTLQCKYFIVPGSNRCGLCPITTVFDEKLLACVCPAGFYKNINGICVQSDLVPVDCPMGKYYDAKEGCLNCPLGCSKCSSATKCTECSTTGLVPVGANCVPKCGDGIKMSGEQCDDGNLISNDGCSSTCKIEKFGPICGDGLIVSPEACDDKNYNSGDGCSNGCKIQDGYKCTGAPSVCTKISQDHGLKLISQPLYNMVNIFVLLQTEKTFLFESNAEMRNFMKYNFLDASTLPSTVYCLQESAKPSDFRCLLVYNSGLPNKKFDVEFSYNYKGQTGFIKVPLDPIKSTFSTRSLA